MNQKGKTIKAFKVLLDNENFEKYNMLEKFLKLYEELDDNILRLSSLNKIRDKQKDIICSYISNNKEYLNNTLDIRSYFFNVLCALEKSFNSKIEKRQFVLYKDRKNKKHINIVLKLGI